MTKSGNHVVLREVIDTDLPIFFEHQRDPEAAAMADFASRDREAFMAHWAKILTNASLIKKTILLDGTVAGNIVAWEQGDQWLVGYWIGREFWGKGAATGGLMTFLDEVKERPLYAYVAKHNTASKRVLEKCGFTICGEDDDEYLLQIGA